MSTYQIGNTITWGLAVTDTTGAAADVGTGPTALVTLPDGTTASASVVKTSTGNYTATYTAAQAGRHRVAWSGSGANSGGLNPYTDVADVWAADPRLIIGLADARAALNVPAGTRVNDDELRLFIAAATPVIEDICGPVLTATTTEHRSGSGMYALALHQLPTAITSVVEDGVTLAATAYCVDESGILWRGSRPGAGVWSANGARNVAITYTVGASTIDPNVILAAREEVRFLWQVGQQGQRPAFNGGDSSTGYTPTGYAVPNRVLELLAASRSNRVPGFA